MAWTSIPPCYNPPPMGNSIIIKGAREHNLKNIDVEIPRDKLVVITGLSGSGKSSLAFDTTVRSWQTKRPAASGLNCSCI